jgi:small subunit ribosomal protein S1
MGKKATSMADLMASYKPEVKTLHKSDILEGTITKLTSAEILVDIGAKTEAVVLEKEKNSLRILLNTLKVGDKVTVSVLNPESDLGNPVVSLRRFMEERLWGDLETKRSQKQALDGVVNDSTKGGFLITAGGIAGFLPNSQVSFSQNPEDLIGQSIKVAIIEVNKSDRRVIFSQKATVNASDFEDAIKGLAKGQKVQAKITNTAPFGIFTVIDNSGKKVEGFIHQSEISWESGEMQLDKFKKGETLDAEITGFDKENKRVSLSLKRLTEDPFEKNVKTLSIDAKATGTVKKVSSLGVTVELAKGVEGLIKKEKLPPNSKYLVGDELDVTVSEIDMDRRRVIVSPVLKEKPIGYR